MISRISRNNNRFSQMLRVQIDPEESIDDALKNLRTHYAIIISDENESRQTLQSIFTTSQISRQLHMDISDAIAKTQSISELQKRQKKF